MQGVGVTDWVAPGERGLFPPSPKAKVPLLRCPLLLSVLVVGPLGGNRSFVGFFRLFVFLLLLCDRLVPISEAFPVQSHPMVGKAISMLPREGARWTVS